MDNRIIDFKRGYTHSGMFHFDDVLCTALIKMINKDIEIIRVKSPMQIEINEDYIVYDIGGGEFDHHQVNKKMRDIHTPYSAFGLLWLKFGRTFLKTMNYNTENIESIFNYVDENFVKRVDISDNFGIDNDFPEYQTFMKFKPQWYEDEKSGEKLFLEATEYGKSVLNNWIREAYSMAVKYPEARELFEKDMLSAGDNKYLCLSKYIPWKLYFEKELKENGILIIIYKSNREGIAIQTTDSNLLSFDSIDFSEYHSFEFIHRSAFIIITKDLEKAIETAEYIINKISKTK